VDKEVKGETIVLDANHPLAGKKLIFDLEVVSID
jgi:FKBP-type peptidyl-prolyl cis-trans isomerase 2